MSSDHGGGKAHGFRRAAVNILHHGRSNAEKEQSPVPQTTPAIANGGALDSRASPQPSKPVRSATVDVPVAPKETNQEAPPRGSVEPTAATSPVALPAQTPASNPPPAPAPVPARALTPAPASATAVAPASTPARRFGSRQPVDPQGEKIKELEKQIQHYESTQYRQELLSIRTHLQVNDLQEPWQISQKFQAINKGIENVSRNLSEFLADTYEPKVSCKTSDFFASSQHRPSRAEQNSPGVPVPMEDFVDFYCRSLINEELMATMFDSRMFHPALGSEQNQMLAKMYQSIRLQESQVIAGRWRVSSFNAHQQTYPFKDAAIKFCQNVLHGLCHQLYGEEAAEKALNKVFSELVAVFEHAWNWYASAKSDVVLLDFEPYFCLPGTKYDPDILNLEGRKAKLPSSGTILLTTRLGLTSSEAQGKGKPPHEIIQLKATALAVEYFMSDR